MATYQVLGDGRPDGVQVVGASTDLLNLYGGTPVDQPAAITHVATTAATSTTNAFGYTTAEQADAIVTAINAILDALEEIGAVASA